MNNRKAVWEQVAFRCIKVLLMNLNFVSLGMFFYWLKKLKNELTYQPNFTYSGRYHQAKG